MDCGIHTKHKELPAPGYLPRIPYRHGAGGYRLTKGRLEIFTEIKGEDGDVCRSLPLLWKGQYQCKVCSQICQQSVHRKNHHETLAHKATVHSGIMPISLNTTRTLPDTDRYFNNKQTTSSLQSDPIFLLIGLSRFFQRMSRHFAL